MVSIVLAGGGTAGHTSPLIATAERLLAAGDVRVTCVGTPKGLESRVVPAASAGFGGRSPRAHDDPSSRWCR